MPFHPGEIYLAYGGGDKHRPVLVVSREEMNRGKYLVAVPFTSANFEARSQRPNCVPFHAGESGLDRDCVAQTEAITLFLIDDLDLETDVLGTVADKKLRDVIKAIGYVLAADCEPA